MGGVSGTHGEKKSTCMVLVRKPKGRTPLERSRSRGTGYIKMELTVSLRPSYVQDASKNAPNRSYLYI
jgi:hypothetical protein